MDCFQRIKDYLHHHHVHFDVQDHPAAYTAQDVAATEHLPSHLMAKVVMIVADGKLAMLVLPASRRVDEKRAASALNAKDVRLAGEHEFSLTFIDCDVGAMPPFGNLYGVPVYVDNELAEDETITFQAGTHTRTITLKYAAFERLVGPTVADLTLHPLARHSYVPKAAEEDIMSDTPTVPAKNENGKLRRRDPFEMFETFQDEMARLWSQAWPFGSWPLARRATQMSEGAALWSPRVDVFEKNGDFVVKAELPGAKKEDIEVTLDEGDLVIRGQKQAETEVKDEKYYRMEQSYGSFYRRLVLPVEATAEQVKATYAEGILEIRIPKPAAETQPAPQTITVA